ncbi:hypothetical protein DKX38_003063 [Salix brachista]|uniref:Uncharacterized protein n=1 Tax=Salix brachista TaxID=2182728 RepID=A0A5N5NNU4_9ROSI|nr:hypothetical protein DKX38_003063 [Salix brachista]
MFTDLVWGDREGTREDGGEGDDDHGDESGDREAEIYGEEGEEDEEHRHTVCEDDENTEREEEKAEIRRNIGDPTVCMLPVGRVGERVDPTAWTRPGGRREMTGGEMDGNPTVRIQSDRESDQLTYGVHPTAQIMPDGESDQLKCGVHPTAQNMANEESELLTSGDNPTADMQSDGESGLLTSGRRERGPPVWMQDYVTGEDLSEYDLDLVR